MVASTEAAKRFAIVSYQLLSPAAPDSSASPCFLDSTTKLFNHSTHISSRCTGPYSFLSAAFIHTAHRNGTLHNSNGFTNANNGTSQIATFQSMHGNLSTFFNKCRNTPAIVWLTKQHPFRSDNSTTLPCGSCCVKKSGFLEAKAHTHQQYYRLVSGDLTHLALRPAYGAC
jgi:hypothetical protein